MRISKRRSELRRACSSSEMFVASACPPQWSFEPNDIFAVLFYSRHHQRKSSRLDRSLASSAGLGTAKDRLHRMRLALIEPLRNVYGVSDKLLNMTLSDILLAAPVSKPLWLETGSSMIAIDTLVHNFLHRTGIQRRLGAEHDFGPACYATDGCADIIRRIAGRIDARQFNLDYPRNFPRYVQHAVWRYCAQSELNVCNGNNIDDRCRCIYKDCPCIIAAIGWLYGNAARCASDEKALRHCEQAFKRPHSRNGKWPRATCGSKSLQSDHLTCWRRNRCDLFVTAKILDGACAWSSCPRPRPRRGRLVGGIVTKRSADALTLKWRDYPGQPKFIRPIATVALVNHSSQ